MGPTKEQKWKAGGGAAVVLVVLLPLWIALRVPGATAWNMFLFLLLASLLVGTLFLHRFLLRNIDNVGEARFDTRNKK